MGRRIHAPEMLPGMPDTVGRQPDKADEQPPARTLDEAITRAHDIIGEALDRFPIVARQALVSGGNDSTVLLHLVQQHLDSSADDAVVHVNTGIGIEETRQYVRDLSASWNMPLRELHPRDSYDDLVLGKVIARTGPNAGIRPVWVGFPGPAGHKVMYRRLKNEPLMRNRGEIVGKEGRTRKVMYLAGMRWSESQRRFRNAEEVDPDGGIVWVSPIVHFTNTQMNEYRRRFNLPRNEVADLLHMSGECECGAYAKEGELEEIETWFPETAYRIRSLEKQAADLGIRNCRWGRKPAVGGGTMPAGMIDPAELLSAHRNERLCSSCQPLPEGQTDLFDTWVKQGLLSVDAARTMAGPAGDVCATPQVTVSTPADVVDQRVARHAREVAFEQELETLREQDAAREARAAIIAEIQAAKALDGELTLPVAVTDDWPVEATLQPVDPIDALGLSARALNSLHRGGIDIVADLTLRTDNDLLEIRYFGAGQLAEVIQALGDHGLALARELTGAPDLLPQAADTAGEQQ